MEVKNLCLGLLSRGDASGYELKKLFEGPLRLVFDASFGSIYPALAQLARDGLLSVSAQAQDGRPDKKIYSLTPKGRLAFMDALMTPPGRDRWRSDFAARLLFAELLPPRHLSQLIDARLAEEGAALASIGQQLAATDDIGQRFVAGLAQAMLAAGQRYLDENRHLLEGAALRSPAA